MEGWKKEGWVTGLVRSDLWCLGSEMESVKSAKIVGSLEGEKVAGEEEGGWDGGRRGGRWGFRGGL